MDVRVDQPVLARALRHAGRAVPTHPKQPVLHAVLIESRPGSLRLTGQDTPAA